MTTTRTRKARTPRGTTYPYSTRWLERYGRTLSGDEVQLVQAYRGVRGPEQARLLAFASACVIERTRGGAR